MNPNLIRWMQYGGILLFAVLILALMNVAISPSGVHALPEYANRTGEPCATCHVSPGGGGPRTLRGLLWAAHGRPDQVPALKNILVAPAGVTDGPELYDIACASCHGRQGHGLFGKALTNSGLRDSKIRSTILRGRERSGMPSFEGRFTDEQLEKLVAFVSGIASGEIEPLPPTYPLPLGRLSCGPNPTPGSCGGN